MKKKIVITIIVVLLILGTGMIYVGVNQNNNEIIDIVEQSGDKEQNETHFGEDKEKVAEKELAEKYKLTDGYSYNEEIFETINFNFVKQNQVINEENVYVNSDGKEMKLGFIIEKNEENDNSPMIFSGDAYLVVDDKKIEVTMNFDTTDAGYSYNVAIVDIDKKDNYKEVVILANNNIERKESIYRLKNDNVELLYTHSFYGLHKDGLVFCKNNDCYIILDKAIEGVNDSPYLGYYKYENGKFEYIDRFLNGEKITNDAGEFSENFRNKEYIAGYEGAGLYVSGDSEILSQAHLKFLRYISNDVDKYDIILMSDIKDEKENVILNSGTVINGVESWIAD